MTMNLLFLNIYIFLYMGLAKKKKLIFYYIIKTNEPQTIWLQVQKSKIWNSDCKH